MAIGRSHVGRMWLAAVLAGFAVALGTWFGPLPKAHAVDFCGDVRTVTPKAIELAAPLRTATNQADVDRLNVYAPNLIAQVGTWLHRYSLWPGWPAEQQQDQVFVNALQDLQDTANAHGDTGPKVQAVDDAATALQQNCTSQGR
jgi:hypothetical protein